MHLFKGPHALGSLVASANQELLVLVHSMLLKEPQLRPPIDRCLHSDPAQRPTAEQILKILNGL